MSKFVVAFRDRDTAEKIAAMLRESGYEVLRICSSGDEIRRTFRMIQDGILISGYRLKDRMLEQAVRDLNENIEILCISDPLNLQKIEMKRIFRLASPVNRTSLTAWADMMSQLHYQRVPERTGSEKELIEKAKKQIMEEMNLGEAEAHRHLQRLSMKLGLRMGQIAERILRHETV